MQTKPARFPKIEKGQRQKGDPLDQVDTVRQPIVGRRGRGEMPRKLLPTHADCGNEAVGDTAISGVSDQGVDGGLPSGLRHSGSNTGTDDNSRIAFRE